MTARRRKPKPKDRTQPEAARERPQVLLRLLPEIRDGLDRLRAAWGLDSRSEVVEVLVRHAPDLEASPPNAQEPGVPLMHTYDAQCTVVDGECVVCGVWHGDPCPACGRRGFHTLDCPHNDER